MVNRLISDNCLNKKSQQGAALLLFFMAILLAGTIFTITNLSVVTSHSSTEQATSDALSKAKEALISYAVSNYERVGTGGWYGFLPRPETPSAASEGNVVANSEAGENRYDHVIGRLPWKHMDIEPLKDGSGECLWYAVSGDYKHGGSIRSEMLNEDSPGMFELYDENANPLKAGAAANRVVAVVIAPGARLAALGQTRQPADPALFCNVAPNNVVATDYLEVVGPHDNAVFDDIQNIDTFVTARNQQNQNINDRIITITQEEIFSAIRNSQSFISRMNRLTESVALCVNEYITTNPVVTGGGGCDLALCQAQCVADENICLAQCNNCRSDCDIAYDACIAAGTRRRDCNRARQICRNLCGPIRACTNNCRAVSAACDANCIATCIPGGGGGNNFWLPWPAPVALSAAINDYRLNSMYNDANTNQIPGRLPQTIDDSSIASGNMSVDMFANCSAITPIINPFVIPSSIDFTDDVNDEYKILWRHWKDHLFYVIGSGFEPSNATGTATPDCATTPASCVEVLDAGGASTYYAAVVIYSGTAAAGQNRDLDKGDYTNYLESYDVANNRFNFTTGQDSDDIAYCISDQRVITKCSP